MKTVQHKPVADKELFLCDELERLNRIQNKQSSPVYEIAFCGHFSAGKSTILNELIGEKILPVSPIPTSANIIRIQNGELKLEAKMAKESNPYIFKNEIPWDRVREWGKNGRDIEYLRVYVPLHWLSKTAVLSDTPGVDSTDPTHGDMTADQLYTTDMVVYVMDYNHVQSETNLQFLKQLTDERKPVMIVINQIDKHSENELTLDSFKSSIRKTFLSWKIRFQDIFLISMKESEHPMNEWPRFEKELKSLMYYNNSLIEDASNRLNIGFYERVRKRIIEDIEYITEEYNDKLSFIGSSTEELKSYERNLVRYHKALEFESKIQEEYQRKQEKLFKNIVLFPHKIRELTRLWLDSEGKSGKPAIWFLKKKKNEERAKQTDVLITELNDQIQTQLAFHVKKYFLNEVDLYFIKDAEEFQKKVYDANFIVSESLLQSFRKKGPVSDAYVFHFTDQVTSHIISEWKKQSEEFINEVLIQSRQENEDQIQTLRNQLNACDHLRSIYEEIEERKSIYYQHLEQIESILDDLKSPTDYYRLIDDIRNRTVDYEEEPEKLNLIMDSNSFVEETIHSANDEVRETDYDEVVANERINQFSILLQQEETSLFLEDERHQLEHQVKRHINQEFVISLFGAFSSGKSSFANALIGTEILPVSPQPATASISEIRRSDQSHPHGTVAVKFKTKAQLQDELDEAGKLLHDTLTIDGLKKWDASQVNRKSTVHQTTLDYVSIIQTGLEKNAEMLEREIECSTNDLGKYAADEQVACLVDHLTIYYDCGLTEEGISLIDTPGVNSIHSRHTQTAFKQLNKSDAIFFLTYFNHAFSNADKHFIEQVSQINDTYSEDKLFFIINASDLAENQNELSEVIDHVKVELHESGVQSPRISAVSSKDGLSAKQHDSQDQSGFQEFEKKFYNEMVHRLKALSYQHAEKLYSRYVKRAYEWKELLQSGNGELTQYKKQVIDSSLKAKKAVDESSFQSVKGYAFQELDEMVLFLRQRTTYQMTDLFNEYINVSTLNADGRKELKNQFIEAAQGYLLIVEQYINTELTTLLIRLENKVNDQIRQWIKELLIQIKNRKLDLDNSETKHSLSLEEKQPNLTLSIRPQNFVNMIQSKRDLFVEQTVKDIKGYMISDVEEEIMQYLLRWKERINLNLQEELRKTEAEVKCRLKQQAEQDEIRLSKLSDQKELESLEKEITHVIQHHS